MKFVNSLKVSLKSTYILHFACLIIFRFTDAYHLSLRGVDWQFYRLQLVQLSQRPFSQAQLHPTQLVTQPLTRLVPQPFFFAPLLVLPFVTSLFQLIQQT